MLEAQESCTKTMNTAKLACQMFIEEMEKQSLGTLDDMGEWFDDNFKRKRRELSFLIRERYCSIKLLLLYNDSKDRFF